MVEPLRPLAKFESFVNWAVRNGDGDPNDSITAQKFRDFVKHQKLERKIIENVNELPIEILRDILAELEDDQDIRVARLVCQRWNEVVSNLIGTTVYIGDKCNRGHHENQVWVPIHQLAEIAIRECYFIDAFFGLEPTGFMKKRGLFYRPNLLLNFHFEGYVALIHFNRLLKPLINLTKVEIHISTISSWSRPVKGKLNLKGLTQIPLKSLKLSSKTNNCTLEPSSKLKKKRLLDNLIDLMSLTLPHLMSFEWALPYFMDHEISLMKVMLEFFINHGTHLRRIKINHQDAWRVDDDQEFQDTEIDQTLIHDLVQKHATGLKILQGSVRIFEFDKGEHAGVNDLRLRFPKSPHLWNAIVIGMKNITHLTFTVECPSFNFKYGYLKNVIWENLVSLDLSFTFDMRRPFDARCLRHSCSLKTLRIINLRQLWNDVDAQNMILDMENPGTEFIEACHMPASVEYLHISDVSVASVQLDDWVLKLRKLTFLHLWNIGQTHGLGIALPALLILAQIKYGPCPLGLDLQIHNALNLDTLKDSPPYFKEKMNHLKKKPGSWLYPIHGFLECPIIFTRNNKLRERKALANRVEDYLTYW